MTQSAKLAAAIASGSLLAGGAGYLGAVALAQSPGEPSRTVTVSVSGQQGPAGPPGPRGPQGVAGPPGTSGAFECNPGFSYGEVVFVEPGEGPTTIQTCLEDE